MQSDLQMDGAAAVSAVPGNSGKRMSRSAKARDAFRSERQVMGGASEGVVTAGSAARTTAGREHVLQNLWAPSVPSMSGAELMGPVTQ